MPRDRLASLPITSWSLVNKPGYLHDILTSGRHLLGLINDILDFAKIEAGKAVLAEDEIDTADLLREVARLMREQANDAGLTLSLQQDDPAPRLRGDTRKLRQVLLNLLSNAVKFTPAGGSVTLSAHRQGADFAFTIAKADHAAVLEPFRQVENVYTRTRQGTGLGLPLSKALVELHGGTMTLSSEPGTGTAVAVVLPADRVLDAEAA